MPVHRSPLRHLAVSCAAALAFAALTGCSDTTDDDASGTSAEASTGDDGSTSDGGDDTSQPEVTGTITLDGAAVEPLDRLMCGEVSGRATIQGMVGDNRISLWPDSASYELDGTTWGSTSGDDRGSLDVSSDGASGTLKMYEDGTAMNSTDNQVFIDLVVDVTCNDQG